jgi:hypothetical protein
MQTLAEDSIDPDVIADYLRRHPDFFTDRPDVLRDMTPPVRWSGDTVIDLQRYVVDVLREELAGLRDCAQSVIETSRNNMATQTRTHAAVLALISARNVDTLLRLVNDDLPILLDVDVASMALEFHPVLSRTVPASARLILGETDRWLGAGQDVALLQEFNDDGRLFGAGCEVVRSAALARLRPEPCSVQGILALGSRSEEAFHPRQGTELLRFLARVVELCLQRLLPMAA